MPGVVTATFPALGFDTDTQLTPATAAALRATGMSFAIRYLSIGPTEAGDLSSDEVRAILGAGLALMAVQHVRYANWMPSAALGSGDGDDAVAHARACDFPAGATIWCDSEGQAGGATASIAYINAWAAAVKNGGYDPGLYVGSGTPLDGQQLYALDVDRYWKSFSQVNEPTCGWSMIQLYREVTIAGVAVDVDVIQHDYKLRLPSWLTV
jgi:hypothetical protein